LLGACGAGSGEATDALVEGLTDSAADLAPADQDGPDAADSVAPLPALRVMTFNVLCFICDPNYDPWDVRLEAFRDLFARHDPDLIGLQELFLPSDVDDILARLPHPYTALYYPGTETFNPYPDATIFYRTDLFEEVAHGFYWLSPTPDDPMTTGFAESQLVRLVAWAHLRRLADGRELYFATMHVDNTQPSQPKSAPLILARTEPWAAEMPVLVTGDFNSKPGSPAYVTLTVGVDGQGFRFTDVHDLAGERGIDTNQEPAPAYDASHRIDHLFVEGADWACSRWTVDLHVYGDRALYPSDHRAISAECSF
jgi:endonuclease/exonuclease/phosphatase family metal-dependent hydrolase